MQIGFLSFHDHTDVPYQPVYPISDILTEMKVIIAASRSRREWRASERIPRLEVRIPTTNFIEVKNTAATIEVKAAFFLLVIILRTP
jgi:hypothetical protein